MQQVTIEWLDLNGKKHTNKIAIPAGYINLSRIDDWFRAGKLNSDPEFLEKFYSDPRAKSRVFGKYWEKHSEEVEDLKKNMMKGNGK